MNALSAEHEGYYYWIAAKAQENRWKIFLRDFDVPPDLKKPGMEFNNSLNFN
jgi:hypothetical protein